MPHFNGEFGAPAVTDSSARTSRFTHDIKDHNNSILLGTDLLHKYWEDLSAHLADNESAEDPEMREAFQEILATIPMVISGIRSASLRLDETISYNFPAIHGIDGSELSGMKPFDTAPRLAGEP